jgi:hypothetical protein
MQRSQRIELMHDEFMVPGRASAAQSPGLRRHHPAEFSKPARSALWACPLAAPEVITAVQALPKFPAFGQFPVFVLVDDGEDEYQPGSVHHDDADPRRRPIKTRAVFLPVAVSPCG